MTGYDVIVIGAGHAGVEAGLAAARLGMRTLCLTLHLDGVAHMACNPAIGGTSKGHLVREVDALGGEMGKAIDASFVQSRMINTRKGPAVHSLRAQADKGAYTAYMKQALLREPLLTLREGEVSEVLTKENMVTGVRTTHGADYWGKVVILCAGVYLKSRILAGEYLEESGPGGLKRATFLSQNLGDMGFSLLRFKTGTPPRINRNSVDVTRLSRQEGDVPVIPFSFLTPPPLVQPPQLPCYLTYTNESTHQILRENLHRSPLYSGVIQGMGARYCPSIEDKIVRFSDKDRHQLFIEPEGWHNDEYYLQGFSTSMPCDIQEKALHTVFGLEQAEITRYGYAIEYDCIDATALTPALMAKEIGGLFFAGQINGSSGYEEAAAQGLLAGINGVQYIKGESPLILGREEGYMGVLVDDLVTLGTPEPYRMMTSRAEYRLLLRQDNADLRLTPHGYRIGLAGEERFIQQEEKRQGTKRGLEELESRRLSKEEAEGLSGDKERKIHPGISLSALLRQGNLSLAEMMPYLKEAYPPQVAEQMEIETRYRGYLERQEREVEKARNMADIPLPPELDYQSITALRLEAREKLEKIRPRDLGQAGRISGVNPSDISVLAVYLKSRERRM